LSAVVIALIGAATFVAGCGDALPDRASPEERAACARLGDISRDRQLGQEHKLLADVRAGARLADRSGNARLTALLTQVRDDFARLAARASSKPDDETTTVIMRASAMLTLAAVECRERGVKIDAF